jgi:hypothetical protein
VNEKKSRSEIPLENIYNMKNSKTKNSKSSGLNSGANNECKDFHFFTQNTTTRTRKV